ncbi:MAG TPA: hypothetical protein VME24_06805 [Alphaproteobacteria bacterium]|nr:hypothetical protein [Alphaproteobacteria bacterium]
MKTKFLWLFLAPFLGFLTGCIDSARFPRQRGTWTGIAEPYTLYAAGGAPHTVLQFDIQDGPRMWQRGFDPGAVQFSAEMKEKQKGEFFVAQPIMARRRYDWTNDTHIEFYAVQSQEYAGKRLEIRGDIELVAEVLDPADGKLLFELASKPNMESGPLGIIRVKRIKVLPDAAPLAPK